MGKDEIKSIYDSSSEFWLKKSRLSERYLSLIEGSLGPDMTVLDLGCGGGRLSFLLAGKAKRIVGCDISPVLIEGAKEKAKNRKDLFFIHGDLESDQAWDECLRTNGEEFDMIVSNVAIRKDALRIGPVLENSASKLVPGGSIVLRIESSGDIPEIDCALPCYSNREIRTSFEERGYVIALLDEERFSQRFSSFEAFSDFLTRTGLSSFLEESGSISRALDKGRSLVRKDGIRLTRSYWLVKATYQRS